MISQTPLDRGNIHACYRIMFLSATVFQRFAIPFGPNPLQFTFVSIFAISTYLLVSKQIKIDKLRLITFLFMGAMLIATSFISSGGVNMISLGLLLVLYIPYIASIETSKIDFIKNIDIFQSIMLTLAILGIVQFGLQFIVHPPFLFTFKGLVPDAILMPGFNTVNPLEYGSTIIKSNGFVFLEPSFFSQFLSIAIIIELLCFRFRGRLIIFCIAIVFSYSGTGMMLLIVFLPVVFIVRKQFGYVLMTVGIVSIAMFVGDAINLEMITKRADEFSATGSSGFERFVGPFYLIKEYQLPHLTSFLLGRGPGSIEGFIRTASLPAFDSTWAKLLFEYGVIGTVGFLIFFCLALFAGSHDKVLSAVLLFFFLFLSGALLSPYTIYIIFLLVVLPNTNIRENSTQSLIKRLYTTPG